MNGIEAWQALRAGKTVYLDGKHVGLGNDTNMYVHIAGDTYVPIHLETIMTSNGFEVA